MEVIREAVARAAADVRDSHDSKGWEQEQEQLAAIVTSAYRLLDPRRRSSIVERIGLLIIPEEDRSGSDLGRAPHLADHRPEGERIERLDGIGRNVIPSPAFSIDPISSRERMGSIGSFEVLAAQDVIDLLRRRDRHARIRLFVLAAIISTSLMAVAVLLFA